MIKIDPFNIISDFDIFFSVKRILFICFNDFEQI
jgi:hypothetical protein